MAFSRGKKTDHFNARAKFILQERKDGPKTRIIEARGPHWKRLRALGSLAFTQKALRNVVPVIERSADMLIDEMGKHQQQLNVLEYFQEYTLDIICKVAFGMHDIKMFENPYIEFCRKMFYRPLRHPITIIPCLFPFIVDEFRAGMELLTKVVPYKPPFVVLMQMLKKTIDDRKALRSEERGDRERPTDFIDLFLDAEVDVSEVQFGENSDTARKLSADEIVGQCFIFLLAGFDTTSNSLSYLSHLLANHPEVQQKVIEEIDSYNEENETINLDRLGDLKYLEATIKESLRHYPLATIAVTRECTKSCEIGGFKFEEGDQIQTDTWTMHMDEQVWGADAKEFKPERWFDSSERARSAFQTFGEGPRICLGMRLAYLEEKIAMIKLLTKFRIEKTVETNPLRLVGSMTVAPEKSIVRLVRR